MKYRIASIAVVAVLAAAGCSGGDESTSIEAAVGTDGGGTAATVDDNAGSEQLGGPEIDAAVDKLVAADSSVDTGVARCIVTTMTADGSIGMGEVLTMNFIDVSSNADRLQEAYRAAVDACG